MITVTDQTIARVAARHILAAFSMDALARLSFLEGVAGVPPGTWLRQKARGFGDAEEWAASKGGVLHPNWTTNRNTGMFDAVAKAVFSILRGVSGIDAEDLAQEIVSESALPGGRANRKQFYSAGQAIGKDANKTARLLDGDLTPSQVRGIPAAGAKRLALNEKKRLREKMEVGAPSPREESRDDFFQQQPSVSVDDPNVRQNVLLMALNSPQSFPGAERIRAVIDTTIDRVFSRKPEKAELMKEFFRELSKGKSKYLVPSKDQLSQLKKDPNYFYRVVMKQVGNQAARNLGISNDTGVVSKTFGSGGKNVVQFIEKYVAQNPVINKVVDKILDDLEFSTEFAYGARVARDLNWKMVSHGLGTYSTAEVRNAEGDKWIWKIEEQPNGLSQISIYGDGKFLEARRPLPYRDAIKFAQRWSKYLLSGASDLESHSDFLRARRTVMANREIKSSGRTKKAPRGKFLVDRTVRPSPSEPFPDRMKDFVIRDLEQAKRFFAGGLFGGSNVASSNMTPTTGLVYNSRGDVVGRFSYNGRFWDDGVTGRPPKAAQDQSVVDLFYKHPRYETDLSEDQIPLESWFSFSGNEPNEYMNYDLVEQDDTMGEPRLAMAAPNIGSLERSVRALGRVLERKGYKIEEIDIFRSGPGGEEHYGPSYVELTVSRMYKDKWGSPEEFTHTVKFLANGYEAKSRDEVGGDWRQMKPEAIRHIERAFARFSR